MLRNRRGNMANLMIVMYTAFTMLCAIIVLAVHYTVYPMSGWVIALLIIFGPAVLAPCIILILSPIIGASDRKAALAREQEERAQREKLERWQSLAPSVKAGIELTGITCPRCGVHTQRMKPCDVPHAHFVCRECGCSFTPDEVELSGE